MRLGERRSHPRRVMFGSERARDRAQLHGDVARISLGSIRGSEGPVAGPHLMLGLMGQGCVDQVQEPVVLPKAEAERDRHRDKADDDARAQLIEVPDDREPVVMGDRPNRVRHRQHARRCVSG